MDILNGYKVDFTPDNSVRSVFGFDRKQYSNGYYESEDIVKILLLSSIRVTCNLISGTYVNGKIKMLYIAFP